jgi:hypothetical protein
MAMGALKASNGQFRFWRARACRAPRHTTPVRTPTPPGNSRSIHPAASFTKDSSSSGSSDSTPSPPRRARSAPSSPGSQKPLPSGSDHV